MQEVEIPNHGDYYKFWDDDINIYSIGLFDRIKPPSSTNYKEYHMIGQLPEDKGFKNAEIIKHST